MSLASDYLQARGITPATITEQSLELAGSFDIETFNQRLQRRDGERLANQISELVWFPSRDEKGQLIHYVARPQPTLKIGPKFIQPKGRPSVPFIPAQSWELREKPHKPIIITEGPVKACSILRAGGYPIGIYGVWNATQKLEQDGKTLVVLCPALQKFALHGRAVFLAFDEDYEINFDVRHALLRTFVQLFKAGAIVRVMRWPLAEGKGIDDYLVADGEQKFAHLTDKAIAIEADLIPEIFEAAVKELQFADLPVSKLEQLIKGFCRKLSVSEKTLSEAVTGTELSGNGPGHEFTFSDPVPADEPVDGPSLIQALTARIKAHVVLADNDEAALAIALDSGNLLGAGVHLRCPTGCYLAAETLR
jgi:hypothetical protein